MADVTIYSTPTCPYCKLAKDWMQENSIAFTDIDVSENQEAAQQMVEKSGQMGVPVILVGEEVIVGFEQSKLEELLLAKE